MLSNLVKEKETIAVTGATGFIGPYVVRYLNQIGRYRVVAVGRNQERLNKLSTDHVVYDFNHPDPDCFVRLQCPDHLIHLAWDGLPDYDGLFHIEKNLMQSCRFLHDMARSGLKRLSIAGTCLEYGKKNGCLGEEVEPNPVTCYGIAKDTLRRYVQKLHRQYPFQYRWLRLFYLYGEGQSRRSLMSQLEQAIMTNSKSFDMSGGEQIRDFLSVNVAAELMVKISLQNKHHGVFNICSGIPMSIRKLVEERLLKDRINMHLNLGEIPYAEYEPMAFWGDCRKMLVAIDSFEDES